MSASSVRGVKFEHDISDERFMRYFKVVQDAALKAGSVFFTFSGEGHDGSTDSMDMEDLSGWLVPLSEADAFESQWKKGYDEIDERFGDVFTFALWQESDDGRLEVSFSI